MSASPYVVLSRGSLARTHSAAGLRLKAARRAAIRKPVPPRTYAAIRVASKLQHGKIAPEQLAAARSFSSRD